MCIYINPRGTNPLVRRSVGWMGGVDLCPDGENLAKGRIRGVVLSLKNSLGRIGRKGVHKVKTEGLRPNGPSCPTPPDPTEKMNRYI